MADWEVLKELRNCIYALFLCGNYFIPYGFIRVYIFHLFFWKSFFFCISALLVFSACSEFDLTLINFCNICIIIIYIVGVRYSVFLFSLITFQLNNLWEQIHVIKTWLQLLTKKHASRVLLGFKNSIHKEKCKIFTNERK